MPPSTVYAIAGLAAAVVLALGLAESWSFERDLVWVRGSAWSALVALAAALCVTPLGLVLVRLGRLTRATLARWRRATGISAAALATLHAAVAMSTYLADSWQEVLLEITWLRSGALALSILGALWLTSYPSFVKRAYVKAWKPLHRLAYLAFALALHHALMAPMASHDAVLSVAVVVVVVGVLRILALRRREMSRPASDRQSLKRADARTATAPDQAAASDKS